MMRHSSTILASILIASIGVFSPLASAHAGLLLSAQETKQVEARLAKERVAGQWVMAYYVGYQNNYLKPVDVDYSLMSHIVVGAVGPNPDGSLREHWNLSNGTDGRSMAKDVGARADRAGVKKLLWLGGPNEQDKFFEATKDSTRNIFEQNVLALLDALKYDGVDIDWEPVRAKDKARLLALVRELRTQRPNLIITVPVNWVPTNVIESADLVFYKDLAQYADRLFIMSYSMAGAWPAWESWHGGALFGDDPTKTPSSVNSGVQTYLGAGVPKEKLGVGIGTYATCWEYPVSAPHQAIPASFTPGKIGTMSMRTFMSDYYSKKDEKWDSEAQVPYLSFSRATGSYDCGFISYENEKSVQAKARYVKNNTLGGVLVWNIGTGFFPTASKKKQNPLLSAIAGEIL